MDIIMKIVITQLAVVILSALLLFPGVWLSEYINPKKGTYGDFFLRVVVIQFVAIFITLIIMIWTV